MIADIRYWDVFPKSIRGFRTPNGGQDMTVQLVLCGDPQGVVFESDDASVAAVTGAGVVTLGMKVGHTAIRVFEADRPENTRRVVVDVASCPGTDVQTIGAANAPGEDTGRYALEGHVHENNLKPGNSIQPVGTANSPGTDDTHFARADHVHEGLTQFGTNIQPVGSANSPGTANQAARVDHVHRGTLPGTAIQTCGANNQAGASEKFAREDHIHKIVWLEYTGA